MAYQSQELEKYLQTRAIKGPWKISGSVRKDFAGAVIIPALAESENIWKTLKSLAQNPPEFLDRFLILVVVNHRQDAPLDVKRNNWLTLRQFVEKKEHEKNLQIGWVDAASPGLELPKKGGVGLARKIGFDLVLTRLNYQSNSPLLVSLDADTLVQPNYLPALTRHFQDHSAGGATIPFRHQEGSTAAEDQAIKRYELFLRAYVFGLTLADSPYAFHTIGSAMAWTTRAYVRAGGMNTRSAGEDFYFLQQLAKSSGMAQVRGTIVYPSARASWRVPFGTGKSIIKILTCPSGIIKFYQTTCFQILKSWLALASQNPNASGEEIQKKAAQISSSLADYLSKIHFSRVWCKLQKNYPAPNQFLSAFHVWFDALKTLQLIHHLSSGSFPRGELEETLPALWQWAGIDPPSSLEGQLTLLRKIQLGEA